MCDASIDSAFSPLHASLASCPLLTHANADALVMQTGRLANSGWGFCASSDTLLSAQEATANLTSTATSTALPPGSSPVPVPAPPSAQSVPAVKSAAPSISVGPIPSAVLAALRDVQVAQRTTKDGTVCRLPVYNE